MNDGWKPKSPFLQFRGQILVVESLGKWTSALRQLPKIPGVKVGVALNAAEIAESAKLLPTLALVESTPLQLLELVTTLQMNLGKKNFGCWLLEKSSLKGLDWEIQRAGFFGILSSLGDLNRWFRQAQEFFQQTPPVDWSLEQRIEHQYPWPAIDPRRRTDL